MAFKDRFGISLTALFAVVLGVFMAILDSTVVNVAIPKMISVFATTQNTVEWVITAYLLVTGMLTPISGFLGDRIGQKRLYLIAVSLFTVGSMLSGLAWNIDVLIMFRILQAVGGAMLIPSSMTILFTMAPPERRGSIMGIWGIALMFAPAIGPILSGYFVEFVDWRLIFYINVPFGILSFFLVTVAIPGFKGRPTEPLDIPGFATSLVGFFALLYALSEAPTLGWNSLEVQALLATGVLSLAAFVVIELTAKNPMLDLRLFKRRVFLATLISTSLLQVAMLGALFILPIFLQDDMGLSPLQTGILTFPGALLTGALMPFSGFMFDRIGARPLAVVGLGIMAVSTLWLTGLNLQWSFGAILVVYMIRSSGMGLAMMPLSTAGMNDVPRHLVSRATALQNTARNVAGSIGTAFLSTIMQTDMSSSFIHYTQRLSVQDLQTVRIGLTLPSVFGPTSAGMLGQLVGMLQQLSFQTGTQDALWVSLFLSVVAWASVFFVGRKKVPVDITNQRDRGMTIAAE
jgi:DHA2 family multidrug resistance protein